MNPDLASCLYVGVVRHRRLRPVKHVLAYRVAYLLVDLDEIEHLRLRWLSIDRANLFGLRSADYGSGVAKTIRERLALTLKSHGFSAAGAIWLLTIPRLFGYAFNPISVFFCHAAGGALEAIVYEVRNTFGERHSYVIAADHARPVVQEAEKAFHVSPFLPMDMRYQFIVTPPGERLSLSILDFDADGLALTASMTLVRRPLSDGALLGLAFSMPMMALKVIAGIHWEALKLWLKGAPVFRWRAAPPHGVTAGRPRPVAPDRA